MAEETKSLVSAPVIEELPDASAVLRHDTRARFWLAIIVLAQFVLLVAYVSYRTEPLSDSQLILGAEVSFVSIVLNYFFGSSSGSVMKTAKEESRK